MLTARTFDRRYYDEHREAGLDYAAYSQWQENYGRWLVESLGLTGRLVLDVGCACGAIARGIQRAGAFACVGVDINESMIAIGRQQWPELRLEVCDAIHLHLFRDATFDCVHVAQVAEHWHAAHVPLVLVELRRVTRPGGLLFCCLDTEELYERQGRDALRDDPTHVTIRPLAWWRGQLKAAGWQIDDGRLSAMLRGHRLWKEFAQYDWDWLCARRGEAGSPPAPSAK